MMVGMAAVRWSGGWRPRPSASTTSLIPRQDSSLTVLPGNIDRFADEWSISSDEMRMWFWLKSHWPRTVLDHVNSRRLCTSCRHVGAFSPIPRR
jgi:hypothetical protein